MGLEVVESARREGAAPGLVNQLEAGAHEWPGTENMPEEGSVLHVNLLA